MIRIFVDSTCDFSKQELEQLGLTMLPLTVNFGAEQLRDGIDIDHAQFYARLRQSEQLPTTSQINPGAFEQAFRPVIEAGDEILGVFISSQLSGTYSSACMAAQSVDPARIFCVDSQTATLGAALLLRQAVRMRDEGTMTAEQIAQRLRELSDKLHIYGLLDTLKYLKMGGRLSGGAAAVGGILGILPMIHVFHGEISVPGKARGERAGMKAMLELIQQHDIDYSYGFAFADADAPERLDSFIKLTQPTLPQCETYRGSIGSTIGTHVGPGVIAVAFIEK